ncbi:hypothetical protein BC829DRAFT_391738, partial [Chytridium lagenaria]
MFARVCGLLSASQVTSRFQILRPQIRFLTYEKKSNSDLPGYILPRQRTKTSWYKKMLRMKFFRMRFGKSGQRPRQPRYGRDDGVEQD